MTKRSSPKHRPTPSIAPQPSRGALEKQDHAFAQAIGGRTFGRPKRRPGNSTSENSAASGIETAEPGEPRQ